MNSPGPLGVSRYKKIVFLTGAGLSKASGLPTYRGEGGVWESSRIEEMGTRDAIHSQPLKVWRSFLAMHEAVKSANPNAGHRAISQVQEKVPSESWVCVLTQNVDGLHQAAGSKTVLEVHGSLHRLRCTRCDAKPWEIEVVLGAEPPLCYACGAHSRFDVVLFDEPVDPMLGLKALALLGDCDLYVAVGTSSLVKPASQFIELAQEAGARTVCVDTDPRDGRFDEYYVGKAEELLPVLLC